MSETRDQQEVIRPTLPFSFVHNLRPEQAIPGNFHEYLMRTGAIFNIQGLGDYGVNNNVGHVLFGHALQDGIPQHLALRTVDQRSHMHGWYAQQAFVREIDILRELEDVAHVPHAYGFAVNEEGVAYSLTEHVQGRTLQTIFENRMDYTPDEFLYETAIVFMDVAHSLSEANKRGIIHKDVKPANIVVREDTGEIVVIDWRTAYRVGGGVTEYNMLEGTNGYAALEQYLGEPATPATDVRALGVILYEMFGGNLPEYNDSYFYIGEEDVLAIREKHMSPIGVPNIADIILRATTGNLLERYPTIDALLEDVVPFFTRYISNGIIPSLDTQRALQIEHGFRRARIADIPTVPDLSMGANVIF